MRYCGCCHPKLRAGQWLFDLNFKEALRRAGSCGATNRSAADLPVLGMNHLRNSIHLLFPFLGSWPGAKADGRGFVREEDISGEAGFANFQTANPGEQSTGATYNPGQFRKLVVFVRSAESNPPGRQDFALFYRWTWGKLPKVGWRHIRCC